LAIALLAAAIALCSLAYLAVAVPGKWFSSASPKAWFARDLQLSGGVGNPNGDELVISAPDATGSALVTVNTDFRSSDYPVIAWAAIDVADQSDVRLLWRSDYAPAKLNSIRMSIASGRLLPVSLAGNPDWLGRITGLALTIRGPFPQPVRIRGVAARPMGAWELASDRVHEWLAFEGWTGTSINTVTGGADVQDLPLPALLAAGIALAALAWFAIGRWGPVPLPPSVLALLFVVGWLVLDSRWTWDLVRQVRITAETYAGKDWRARHMAAEDGPLFAFIENVRAKLPPHPARVYMAADAHYFRSRGAYHLYPHNVFMDPYRNTIPLGSQMRSGDYLVVYQRRGVQFDAGAQRLRWDGGEPIAAEALLIEPGAALFRIR
jgi:hypothetical protein